MIALLLLACRPDPPPKLLDTGWFDDTAEWTGRCAHHLDTTVPTEGVADWYWRHSPRIYTATHQPDAYDAYLLDAVGARVPSELVWADGGGSFEVRPSAPLRASAAYTLRVIDCEGAHEVGFQTSGLGAPLVGGPAALQGRTFDLRLQQATWLEPGGVAPLLTLYFEDDLILGVPFTEPSALHLNLALAFTDDDGTIRQYTDEEVISFPVVDFSQAPYFAADTPAVELVFGSVRIPVYDFRFSGTFAADGSFIGGGEVSGVGDSRYAGVLLGDDDPGTICELAASLGVLCGPCPTDQEPYCLPVAVADVRAPWVPGLTVQAL